MEYKLPISITPRPGEKIVAYQGLSKHEGTFVGYNISDSLIMKVRDDSYITIREFLQIRPENPFDRKEPCWNSYLNENNCLHANAEQRSNLNSLLDKVITPGPSYLEFINEIWNRGYETFLVGGSIRDVINGGKPKDVDLVTTIPFNLLVPLVKSMFGEKGYSRKNSSGFMSVGFNAGDYENRSIYDPLIDVKNFFSYAPGTRDAQFGANLEFDHKLRDFACNAIYYEPINSFFIDPSGIGISDAEGKQLNLINDTDIEHPKYKKADISFRFFKFVRRGYTPSESCVTTLNAKFKPIFMSIGHAYRLTLFKKYFLKDSPRDQHEAILVEVEGLMIQYGYQDIWEECFEPFKNEMLEDE